MILFSTALAAWGQEAQKPQEPPEEDTSIAKQEYSFNPLQAEKEVKVGEFYMKKGSYKAAEARFREATKWNPKYGLAWLRLGDVEEKLKDRKAAREAFQRFLDIAPEDKRAGDIRKKLEHDSAADKRR